jgi:hypothetical protein
MDEFTGRGTPLSAAGFEQAEGLLGCAPEALWSVLSVETSGCGYLRDRRPKILFERHYFHKLTAGHFDAIDPDVSAPSGGGYGASGDHQYVRLHSAMQLDREAALKSASWGLGQIMGANHQAAGFPTVGAMVEAFVLSEDEQLRGMATFVAGSGMKAALAGKDWQGFARRYNGPNYAAFHYDEHLSQFCSRFVAHGCPDIGVRAAQVLLNYRGYDTGGIDGLVGGKTRTALSDFQTKHGLNPVDGAPNPATLAALAAD